MSFASACQSWEAAEMQRVQNETFGHLYPKLGKDYEGDFIFIKGGYQAVDCQAASINFDSLPDSPVIYEDVNDFIFKQACNRGPWASMPDGVYKWSGTYRKFKNANCQFIKGKLILLTKI